MKSPVFLMVVLSFCFVLFGEKGYEQQVKKLKAEIASLKKENAMLRAELEKAKKPQTRKVWKQVRPPIQIEGSIDDGYELVEEVIDKGWE